MARRCMSLALLSLHAASAMVVGMRAQHTSNPTMHQALRGPQLQVHARSGFALHSLRMDEAAAAQQSATGEEETTESPSKAAGAESLPPASFQLLVEQAAAATDAAMKNGAKLMEVEFPPVPLSKLEDSSISAYDLLRSNLLLAVEFCKKLVLSAPGEGDVAIVLPDIAERERAVELLGDKEPWPKMRLWALSGGDDEPTPFGFLGSLIKGSTTVEPAPWAKVYVVLSVSCSELPSLRSLAEAAPEVPIVCFNLKLDTLRGDLGLPTFPSKGMHHSFLSRVKPVYYMRPRAYSLSLSRPPFLISYAGVLFRCYPEGFQTLLDRGRGSYRRVNVNAQRPALGEFKAELTQALKLQDDIGESAISQTGFKQSTWWEDNADGLDESNDWRE